MKAVIVDDEAPARSELRYLLAAHPEVEVVGEAATAAEAFALARRTPHDVVFLDVQMPGLSGLDAARLIREQRRPPAVVFVTAHERYAVDAFAVEALDYLLKPVDPRRLAQALERVRDRPAPDEGPLQRIPVVASGATSLVDFDAVHYVQADGDYCRVHTFDRSYLCTSSLGELEERLPSTRFVRIHRSYLVNLAKVASVGRAGPERLRLRLDDEARTELDVARRQSRLVRQKLRL